MEIMGPTLRRRKGPKISYEEYDSSDKLVRPPRRRNRLDTIDKLLLQEHDTSTSDADDQVVQDTKLRNGVRENGAHEDVEPDPTHHRDDRIGRKAVTNGPTGAHTNGIHQGIKSDLSDQEDDGNGNGNKPVANGSIGAQRNGAQDNLKSDSSDQEDKRNKKKAVTNALTGGEMDGALDKSHSSSQEDSKVGKKAAANGSTVAGGRPLCKYLLF